MPKKAITKRVARLLKSENVAKQQKGADIYKRRDESIEAKKMKKTKKAINKYIKNVSEESLSRHHDDITGFQKTVQSMKEQKSKSMNRPMYRKEKLQPGFINPEPKFMMYGKLSSPLKSESPLAKYGCSKKH